MYCGSAILFFAYSYRGMLMYQAREVLARVKAFLYVEILQPKPKFLGKAIPITGDGRATE
jgi:SanA protein